MSSHPFKRLFTPSEANELIPRLEALMRGLQRNTIALRGRVAELAKDSGDNNETPSLDEIVKKHPELQRVAQEITEHITQIGEYGCFLKDIDLGLVDFPSRIGDQTVFLCWQFGEPQVSAWHGVDEGFSSRRPLSGARKTYLN